jgi:hypothetical protein
MTLMNTLNLTRFFTWRNVAVLALVSALFAGGARIALGDDGPSEDALRKDDYIVGELDTADDSDDDNDLTAAGSRSDGDDTAGNDGTNGGNNTGDGDDTAGNDGTNGGNNTGDGTNSNSADSDD